MPERVIGRPRPRHCWEAAASVRSTPYGREVLAFLRPRTNGLFRSRAPIWIQLVRAAREGRLIWHGTESFAVLRRPADRAAPGDGRILRGADREWTLVLLAGAFLVFVVVVLLIVALRGVIGGTVAWYAAALTGTLLLGLFAADQTVALAQLPWRGVRSLVRGRPRRDEVAAEMLPFELLGLLALAVLSLASVIAHWESAACVTDCARRPAGYPAALDWVLHRLVWRNPPGITAATFYARGMGVLIGAFVPLTVLMGIASAVHYRKYRAGLRAEVAAMVDDMNRDRILLLVATDVERAAVLRRVATEPGLDYSGGHPVQRLGVIGGAEVLLAQTGPGVTGPLSTAYSVPELLREWRPKYLIMLGICYGLREEEQGLGDVLVGERLQVINLRVGETDVRDRGDAITAGHRLVERFRLAVEPPGVRIHRGTLLSWDLLVDFAPLRAALKDRYPDALGGEMEGAGVYAASARASTDIGTEWIVVKAICDWGRNKTGEAQARAAANAATVVLDLIETGAFARYEPR